MVSGSSRPPSLPGFCAPWCNKELCSHAPYLSTVNSKLSQKGVLSGALRRLHVFLDLLFPLLSAGMVNVQSVCIFSQWSRKENFISCFEQIAQIFLLNGVGVHIVHQVYWLFPGFMTFGALCMLKTRGRMSGIIDRWVHTRPWFYSRLLPHDLTVIK